MNNKDMFGDFGGLDKVGDQTFNMDFGFDNKMELDHEVIDKKNNIRDIDIETMIIPKKHEKTPITEESSESSVELSEKSTPTHESSQKNEKNSQKSKTPKSSNVSIDNSPLDTNINNPAFNFGDSTLSDPDVRSNGSNDSNGFQKPKIEQEIIKNNKEDKSVKIDQKSEESSSMSTIERDSGKNSKINSTVCSEIEVFDKSDETSTKTPAKTPKSKSNYNSEIELHEVSPNNSKKTPTASSETSKSKKTSVNSSESSETIVHETADKTKKTTPVNSPNHDDDEVNSTVTSVTHRTRKYQDIDNEDSYGSETTSHINESMSSFKPDLTPKTNPNFDIDGLSSEDSTIKNEDPHVKSRSNNQEIEIIDKKKHDTSVVINDIDEDDHKSKKDSNKDSESSNVVHIPERDKKKEDDETNLDDYNSDLVVHEIGSSKSKTVHNSHESSTLTVHEESIDKTEKTRKVNSQITSEESSSYEEIETHSPSHKTIQKKESDNSSSETVIIEKNPSQDTNDSETTVLTDDESEETNDKDKFNLNPDGPITNENLHKKKKKKNDKFHGKTIIALQFVRREERGLASVNPRSHKEKRREIMMMFNLLPSCVKKALLSCKPKPEKALKKCESIIAGAECEVQNMLAQLTCASDETFFNGACYKNCPKDMEDDTLLCVKSMSKSRRAQKWDPESEEEIDSTQEIWGGILKVIKCEVFGPSYRAMGPDVCTQKCPYGWKNLGNSCQKPARFLNQPKVVIEADDE
jgi:hypothetical protein